MARTIHIIGAGLAGLSAAVRLAQGPARVIVHEALRQAGGRCRSYFDTATSLTIDNGNHLLLSGNRAALDYLATIGSRTRLIGPAHADFPFADLATGERWTIRINDGRIPWWIFDVRRRVPGTSAREYFGLAPLLWSGRRKTVGDVLSGKGPLYRRLVQPLLVAALNTSPSEASAQLAGAIVKETLGAGGAACRPLIARDGLSQAFIDPALGYLRERGATVVFEHELHGLSFDAGHVAALDFKGESVPLADGDAVVIAVPPRAAQSLVAGLEAPSSFRAIVNAHFRIASVDLPPIMGVIGGTAEWLFTFADRVSVTISVADHLIDTPREKLARAIWEDISRVAAVPPELPPWQIVRERRATFAATPKENAKRPPARTAWRNLFLAGDWTATGLPATIEGSIRSGQRAADHVTQMQ